MLNNTAESSMPAKQREADQGLLSDRPSRHVAPLKRSDNPPAYGAQNRQDALWKGGNEALPSMWTEFRGSDDGPFYRDDTLFMYAVRRPIPGVRLDHPGEGLVPGCEWHITPHGRSYFVNHNTRTTSWKKPTPERTAGRLMPEGIIECNNWFNNTLAWLGTSGNIIMSTSGDGSIHQWTRAGKPVGMPCDGDGNQVTAMAMPLDESMVVCGSSDGRVRLWNVKEGSVVGNSWEGNNVGARCLDWSPNGLVVAGGFFDGTIRRWNPATGRQIAPPIKRSDKIVRTVKYSPQGDKFASGGEDNMIHVWSKGGKLLIEIKGHVNFVTSLCWSKDGKYIFSASNDGTIRKWQSIDGKELVVFQGHTNLVISICLSPDGCHLVSASKDYSARIWDLETNQQLGDPLWHDDHISIVAMSSDGQYFASAIRGPNGKIYVWSLVAALKRACGVDGNADPNTKLKVLAARPRNISLVPKRQSNNPRHPIDVARHQENRAAAAMRRTNSNNADSSTARDQVAMETQASTTQARPTQTQSAAGEPGEEISCEVSCCCFIFTRSRRRRQEVV